MRQSCSRSGVVFLSVCFLAASAGLLRAQEEPPAGQLGALKPAEAATPVLGGRLTLRLPEGAKDVPLSHGIMSAAASVEEKTRLMLDAGPERLVVLAREELARAPEDFGAAVRARVEIWNRDYPKAGYRAGETAERGGLRFVDMTPEKPLDVGGGAWHLRTVYVARKDRTVQSVAFYVNPDGLRDLRGCSALVDAIAATIAAGERELPLDAGVRELATAWDLPAITMNLPEGYVTLVEEGPDFLVHRIRELGEFPAPGRVIGIYIGDHPSYQHTKAPLHVSTRKVGGRLFGEKAEWVYVDYREKADGPVTDRGLEAIVPLPDGGGVLAHVFAPIVTEEDREALRAIAETLAVKKR